MSSSSVNNTISYGPFQKLFATSMPAKYACPDPAINHSGGGGRRRRSQCFSARNVLTYTAKTSARDYGTVRIENFEHYEIISYYPINSDISAVMCTDSCAYRYPCGVGYCDKEAD